MRAGAAIAVLLAGCSLGVTERIGSGVVEGVSEGYGQACDMATAERLASEDVEAECRRLSGRPCHTTGSPDCRRGNLPECPRGGALCSQQGMWTAPDGYAPRAGTGAGSVTGAAIACSRDEATRQARDDATSQCRERSGQECRSFAEAVCRDAIDSECPRRAGTVVNASRFTIEGQWESPGEGERESDPPDADVEDDPPDDAEPDDAETPAEIEPCRWDFCHTDDAVCDFNLVCRRQNGLERRCDDLYEQESPACRGDQQQPAEGDCPEGYCLTYDGYCDYDTECVDDDGNRQSCVDEAERTSGACGGEPSEEPAEGDSCEGYDWSRRCVPCDGDDHNGDGCCIDDFEGDFYCAPRCDDIDWSVFCVECDGRDDDADPCCDGWDYEEADCWEE